MTYVLDYLLLTRVPFREACERWPSHASEWRQRRIRLVAMLDDKEHGIYRLVGSSSTETIAGIPHCRTEFVKRAMHAKTERRERIELNRLMPHEREAISRLKKERRDGTSASAGDEES